MVLRQMRKAAYSKLIDNIGIKKKMVIVLLVFSAIPFLMINMLSFAAGRHLILKLMAETSSEQLQKTNEEIRQEVVNVSLSLLELRYNGQFLRDLVEEDGEHSKEIVEDGEVVKRLALFPRNIPLIPSMFIREKMCLRFRIRMNLMQSIMKVTAHGF